jgi:type II secretory pathway component PulF
MPGPLRLAVNLWLPVGVLALATISLLGALSIPPWRRRLRWHFPAFKEAGLSQLASALALMLQNGCSLNQALNLVQQLEAGSPAQKEIRQWQSRLALGHTNMAKLAAGGKVIPPLFVWLVAGSGEDWPRGFRHAAEIYYARAMHRVEVLLYAVLPVSVMALGLLILLQVLPIFRVFLGLMRVLGSVGEAGD